MSSSEDSNNTDNEFEAEPVQFELLSAAAGVVNGLIPDKSNEKYWTCYKDLVKWKEEKKIDKTNFEEAVFLVYFKDISSNYAPSTLWSRWSMLRSVMDFNHGIDLRSYTRLKALVKKKSKGYIGVKSKVFTAFQINDFLTKSPDEIYLAMKVVLIFGISGAMRSGEFCPLTVKDVEDTGSRLIVTIRDTINYYPRSFVIESDYYETVMKYISLRPKDADTNRFFLRLQSGKCTRQVIGKNKITQIPQTIALFLNLPEIKRYTGHCFRRTSATLLADSGADISTLKRHGGWRSDQVARGYVEDSVQSKSHVFQQINNFVDSSVLTPSSSVQHSGNEYILPIPRTLPRDDVTLFSKGSLELVTQGQPAPLPTVPPKFIEISREPSPLPRTPPKQVYPIPNAQQSVNLENIVEDVPDQHLEQPPKKKKSQTKTIEMNDENLDPETEDWIAEIQKNYPTTIKNCTITNLTINYHIKKND